MCTVYCVMWNVHWSLKQTCFGSEWYSPGVTPPMNSSTREPTDVDSMDVLGRFIQSVLVVLSTCTVCCRSVRPVEELAGTMLMATSCQRLSLSDRWSSARISSGLDASDVIESSKTYRSWPAYSSTANRIRPTALPSPPRPIKLAPGQAHAIRPSAWIVFIYR